MTTTARLPPLDVTIVTVCMNRQEHLRRTAPVVAAWPWHAEHLIVDWSSAQPLRRQELPDDPRLRLLRVDGEIAWNPARAYNFACQRARHRLLLRLDADCFPTAGFQLASLIGPAETQPVAWVGSGSDGRFGQFLLAAALFRAVGGFNEAMRGWGFEDKDLRARLQAAGLALQPIPPDWIGVIAHAESLRMSGEPSSAHRLQQAHALALKQAQMLANRLVAAHRPWSAKRLPTCYHRSAAGAWRAESASVPTLEGAAAGEISRVLRVTYWARLLGIPELILEQLPDAWFPAPEASIRSIRWSHRGYWLSLTTVSRAIPWLLRRGPGRRFQATPVFVSAEAPTASTSPPPVLHRLPTPDAPDVLPKRPPR